MARGVLWLLFVVHLMLSVDFCYFILHNTYVWHIIMSFWLLLLFHL